MLEEIYNNINNDKIYGCMINSVKYPYFHDAIYKTSGGYIGYTHFGSSAVENTIFWLEFIIKHIFKMSPEEFAVKFECR